MKIHELGNKVLSAESNSNSGERKIFPGIFKIYPPLPRKSGKVNFDIYDYQMIFNDEPTKKLIREGNTIGCFYIESPGMRSLLRRLNVDDFKMLTAASSIIRPGVAESGMMQEFIARHKDPKKRKFLIPELAEILGETYGIMIYQEDVIKVAHLVAGLTLEEADLLRRAMSGKMRSHSAMIQIKDKFFSSCRKNNLSDFAAKELWRQIESFAGYAFCKAHSASFALLSFQVAYLKAHFPAEFLAAVLTNQGGYYTPEVYVNEAKRLKIKIELPCVNKSEFEYSGKGNSIRIGFMAVKNLSKNSIDKILNERKKNGNFTSLLDFLTRTKLAYEETASLIKCGAMDCFNFTRPSLMRLLDVYLFNRKILNENYNDLFINESFQLEKEVITNENYSIEEICRIEYETFGYMVSKHPLNFFEKIIDHPGVTKAAEIHKLHNKKVRMIGWHMASKRIKTKSGRIMKFLSLEDLSDTFEAVLFPDTYEKFAEKTLSAGPYFILGKVDAENGNNIIVEKLEILSSQKISSISEKDGSENSYFGDVEKISEEEFSAVKNLGEEYLTQILTSVSI